MLPVAMLLLVTGCDESNRLAAEIDAVAKETSEVRAQLEDTRKDLNRIVREHGILRLSPALKQSTSGKLEAQVKELRMQKEALESEVATLRETREAYLKANR
jgi:hypothetical protein